MGREVDGLYSGRESQGGVDSERNGAFGHLEAGDLERMGLLINKWKRKMDKQMR
jgi:hypothetical protein